MGKWIGVAIAVAALVILVLWKLTAPAEKAAKKPVLITDAAVEPTGPAHTYNRKVVKRPQAKLDAGIVIAPPEKLNPKSEAFNHRIDVAIADRLRAHASRCYKGGGDPDASMKIFYRLRIENGAAWVTDVKVKNAEIDAKIARCMSQGVERATWRTADMPDYTTPANDPEMVFIRLRALGKRKYRLDTAP